MSKNYLGIPRCSVMSRRYLRARDWCFVKTPIVVPSVSFPLIEHKPLRFRLWRFLRLSVCSLFSKLSVILSSLLSRS